MMNIDESKAKMAKKLFPQLSHDLTKLITDRMFSDVIIETGKEGANKKIFKAHSSILYCRSPYLRKELLRNERRNKIIEIKLNISVEVFQILLGYMYNGLISFDNLKPSEIYQILIASEKLELKELIIYIQSYLIEHHEEWLRQNFVMPKLNNESSILPTTREILDSTIITIKHAALIAFWIRQTGATNSKIYHAGIRENPYKFQLLLRGSRDGFTPSKFHQLCDNKSNTLVILKVKETGELLGGFNPNKWKSVSGWGKTNNSFIFSLSVDVKNLKNSILSRVKRVGSAINYEDYLGPSFGFDDITINGENFREECKCYCSKHCYEKEIRNVEEYFSLDDYEVFQIKMKN